MFLEWLIFGGLLLGAVLLLVRRAPSQGAQVLAACLLAGGIGAAWCWQQKLRQRFEARADAVAPHVGRPEEYAGSASCRGCHPDQYASWHRTFHRTMTQVASPESIRGSF